MNAMLFMTNEIQAQIPRYVLELAFINTNYRKVTSLSERIMNNVIRARLMTHLNLASQETIQVPSSVCEVVVQNDDEAVYRVPKSMLGGRSIVSALVMADGANTYHSQNFSSDPAYSGLQLDGAKAAGNLSTLDIVQTAKLDLIGDNTILVYENSFNYGEFYFKVAVENDVNLTNINPRSYKHLGRLAVLITKAYIYNELVVEMGKGHIFNGHELNIVNEIIDRYADAEELYQQYYDEHWEKVAFMNNSSNMHDFITAMFGNTI